MPENVGVVGGDASCFTVTPFDAVPPALVAVQVSAMAPSLVTGVGPQPVGATTGEPLSARLQVTLAGPVYQRWAPVGAPGLTAGEMVGGVVSSACCISPSARSKPKPQSRSGTPAVAVQSVVLAGFVRIA